MIDSKKLEIRGYEGAAGELMAEKLSSVDEMFFEGINLWITEGKEMDYEVNGVRLSDLMLRFSMRYPAAVLTMDWLIRCPEEAMAAINKGIR